MNYTPMNLAVPPTGASPTPAWVWIVVSFFVLAYLVSSLSDMPRRRRLKRTPVPELASKLREQIRTGTPDVRGHIRVSPGDYPGISAQQATEVAIEEGFSRQTHGAKGNWLFFRDSIRNPVHGEGLGSQEGQSGRKVDKVQLFSALALFFGCFSAYAHLVYWVIGTIPERIAQGDGPLLVATHVVTVAALAWAGHIFRRFKKGLSGRAVPEGPDVDAGDPSPAPVAVAAKENDPEVKERVEKLTVRVTLLLLIGVPAAIAHVVNWVNGNIWTYLSMGDWPSLTFTHALTLLVLALAVRCFHGIRVLKRQQ